ncbi:MAG TPA: RsmB/NOP family class I SAM-dependent RNA methyltransferase [Candidatus Caldiarchaeum subterraneum]|uniref:RsmB/NOP family class I SAM-dependent RNA methyltransferase n=1 Tax=Caldiarchaeum subterraneum TaxID=311458 RepID=A0A832ZVY7_CALS0|nr:RsmB/NOP family class I SAM-dependent RNA methyltransferase [Candidatus Caldarchaeum subterraneum]
MKNGIQFSEELLKLLSELPGVDFERLLESYNTPLPESIRINTLKTTPSECIEMLEENGFSLTKIPWTRYGYYVEPKDRIAETLEHMLGLVYMQGPVSMLVAEVLDVKHGDRVLDLCAAPGSKSTQIGQYLENSGALVANDISYERIKALSSNLQRCGVVNVIITLKDGRMFGRRYPDTFDKVLVDAPCSSLGIISRDWSIAKRWRGRISERMSRLQLGLITSGFDALKPGGTLVYATCTLHPLENEWVIDQLLERRSGKAKLLEIKIEGIKYSKPIVEWNGDFFHPEVSKCIRIYPYQSGAEGFFISKITKTWADYEA